MSNDDGRKPERAPEHSSKARVGAPAGVDGNGPKRFCVQRKMAIVARFLRGEPLELAARERVVPTQRSKRAEDGDTACTEQLGRPETLFPDDGYFSEANVKACTAANIEPLIATGRHPHHPSWRERFAALDTNFGRASDVQTGSARGERRSAQSLIALPVHMKPLVAPRPPLNWGVAFSMSSVRVNWI
jgi:hypothetical protein